MAKIIHLITETNTGGAETMLYRLISNMKPGFENVVVSMIDKGSIAARIEALGIKVYALRSKRGKLGPAAFFKLIQIFSKEKPQVLQTWLYHADLFGLLAAKITGIKIILWNIRCSCVDIKKFPLFKKIIFRVMVYLSRIPQAVVFNSAAGIATHRRIGYRPRKSVIINNGLDLNTFYPKLSERKKLKEKIFGESYPIVIGSVSRFDPLKDHQNFLRGIKIFSDRYPEIDNVKFIFIGLGMNNNNFLLNLVKSLEIREKVIFMDERDDIQDIMPGFDIYCSSSCSEGFPNTIGESMACGVPCVATDAGDSALLIDKTGIIVPIKDSVALASAWHEMILMGEEKRQGLGILARKRIELNFSIGQIARQYETLYTDLIKDSTGTFYAGITNE